jgi:type IV pilus assembly protein PilY1
VQVTRTVDTTGYLDQTVVEETRTPTTTTEVTSRKQQTDFQRVVVIDNGKVISDTPTQTTTTLSDVLETTTGPTAGTPTKSGSDTGLVRRETSTKTTDTGATNVDCLAPNTAGYPKTSNYVVTYPPPAGTGTTQVGTASSTVPLPRKEGWIGTPAANKTDVETTAEFESTNGVGNTLADVAAYYYETDLRDAKWSNCTNTGGKDVCTNNVPGTALKDPYKSFGDSQRQQHMTTFTLGLGVSGSLDFDPRYQLLRSGDFHDIVNLARNWPNTTASSNSTVDDLWHAAVNGRGQYFSAGNPAALTAGINAALAAIDTVVGAASAASTSSLQPVEGDNDIYVAQFTTKQWIGDVLAYKIDPNNGDISKTFTWSAQARLELADPAKRTIYYRSPKTNGLTSFTHTNLSTDGLNGLFDNFCSLAKASAVGTGGPLQCATLTDTDKTSANNGDNLVKYLRGDQTMTYYRTRTARLGDIINASPLFVGKPAFKYTENDYGKFATANVGRTAVVLAAANDGMLHALDRGTGNELWAYIPSFVMENMPKLADEAFQNSHSYFVDGSPQMGDVYDAGAKEWKTIVVGGLNKGGRGYYALDLTDPTAPKVLWEFSHANLGYTYGNPIITKRKNGEWVVVFASGYDNGSSVGGDGNGHLFVLDALTGKEVVLHGQSIVDTAGGISTMDSSGNPAGTAAKPSGMAKINVWVDSETNNTARRFYGGDELGNLWRFDIDGEVAPNGKALLLAQLQLPAGTPQPITTKPVLAELEYNGSRHSVVYVATGTYMRTDDPKATGVQSVYAIKDPLIDQPYGDLRNGSFAGKFVVQVITAGEDAKKNPTRSSTAKTVDWTTMAGWRADFPVGGERVSVNPQIALDTLFVGSNLPKDEDCSVGGNSFLYQFNILTGKASAVYVGNVLLQGLTLVQLVKGASAGSIETIITRSDGKLQKEIGDPPEVIGTLRRTSWREIVD